MEETNQTDLDRVGWKELWVIVSLAAVFPDDCDHVTQARLLARFLASCL